MSEVQKFYVKLSNGETEELLGDNWRAVEGILIVSLDDEVVMVFSLANMLHFWYEEYEGPLPNK